MLSNPIVEPIAANSLPQGNNGALLTPVAPFVNEGGSFSGLKGAAQGGNGSALDGVALVENVGATPVVATSGANASVTLTIAAVAAQKNYLLALSVSCTPVSSTAATLTVVCNGVTWTFNFPSGGLGSANVPVVFVPLPAGGLAGAVNATITATLTALGATVVGTINAAYVVG